MKCKSVLSYVVFYAGCSLLLGGCKGVKESLGSTDWRRKSAVSVLVAEKQVGWLKYQLYFKPQDPKGKNQIVVSLRVINTENNVSPLRRISNNIEAYSTYYEYLLNSAKNDFILQTATYELYPKWFAFENNYNAFPFEVLNVGFEDNALRKKDVPLTLLFTDRVFSHNVVSLKITK